MTTVTIQSNKIVSTAVKDNQALLESSYRKKCNGRFGQPSKSMESDFMFQSNEA